jgi:hypothetical protein
MHIRLSRILDLVSGVTGVRQVARSGRRNAWSTDAGAAPEPNRID